MKTKKNHLICQFKITLNGIEPPIWRRIQVPATYSFWDLHVAFQDAMGWLDYHLHEFRISKAQKSKIEKIGIPDDDFEKNYLAGWDIPISNYFKEPGKTALYEYDFGDRWEHEVLLEAILLKEKAQYPKCIAGERSCPPEDCRGVPGYYDLLNVLSNPNNDEYQEMINWLKGHAKNYYPYEPDKFNPEHVHFDNPKKRWMNAFPEAVRR
ncbi:MAG: hypothetical protein QG657_4425 [Acidobacteriota bacterium]|nr:hypothetical protein [Acidobacteriota bacterium]